MPRGKAHSKIIEHFKYYSCAGAKHAYKSKRSMPMNTTLNRINSFVLISVTQKSLLARDRSDRANNVKVEAILT